MLVEMDVVMVGAEVREKVASCWRTKLAGILIDLVPGVEIAGIEPERIFLRMLWPDTAHRAASVETEIKLSFIKYCDRCQSFCRILIHQNRPGWRLLLTL
jgi:hypothetical protein